MAYLRWCWNYSDRYVTFDKCTAWSYDIVITSININWSIVSGLQLIIFIKLLHHLAVIMLSSHYIHTKTALCCWVLLMCTGTALWLNLFSRSVPLWGFFWGHCWGSGWDLKRMLCLCSKSESGQPPPTPQSLSHKEQNPQGHPALVLNINEQRPTGSNIVPHATCFRSRCSERSCRLPLSLDWGPNWCTYLKQGLQRLTRQQLPNFPGYASFSRLHFTLCLLLLSFFHFSLSSSAHQWCLECHCWVDHAIVTLLEEKPLMGCSKSLCINSSLVERERRRDGWRRGEGLWAAASLTAASPLCRHARQEPLKTVRDSASLT